jgi:hypothetical protein
MRKLLKKQGFSPKLLITDKLRFHASALEAIKVELSLLTRAQTKQSGGKLASSGATMPAQAARCGKLHVGAVRGGGIGQFSGRMRFADKAWEDRRRRSTRYMVYRRVLSRTRAVSFSCRNPKYRAGIDYPRKAHTGRYSRSLRVA